MAGALIQLVAKGVQDMYLTGDPQITFFKVLYRRHTNFSVESVPQYFSHAANFGETVSCIVSRAGDLVGRITLYVELPGIPKFIDSTTGEEDLYKKIAWVRCLGYALVKEISVEIGETLIDKHYGEWLYIWSQLTCTQDKALVKMIGDVPKLYEFSNGKNGYQLYIPLEFWFCQNIGLALPLVALSSADVKLTVTFRKLEECCRIGPTHSIEILENAVPFKVGDYIYQTVLNKTIHGYFLDFDYVKKKLFYIKIFNPLAQKKTFESYQESNLTSTQKNILPRLLIDDVFFPPNIQYRIYKTLDGSFCTPKPMSKEIVEKTSLPYKPTFVNAYFYVDYVYLDNEERTKFISTNHEYLITQLQFNQEIGIKNSGVKQNLTLNHPCKAHYWVAQLDSLVGPGTINDLFNYTTSHVNDLMKNTNNINYTNRTNKTYVNKFVGKNIIQNAKLILNGRDRFSERPASYFNLVQPYNHYTRGPKKGINVYSFSLHPMQHQPSSCVNMSKMDQIAMHMRLDNSISDKCTVKIRSYTTNYNILRVMFGRAGLVF